MGHFVQVDEEGDFTVGVMVITEVIIHEFVGNGERWVGLSEILLEEGGKNFRVDPKGLVCERVGVV